MRLLPALLLLLPLALPSRGQTDTGRIIDSVTCAADPTQTYALYLPAAYTSARAWPLILCFDPGARGRTPVERLQAAAEKYGYIVAGSLTSRNGPAERNLAAYRAMAADLRTRYAVDPARVYTTGMSGGARFATAIALAGGARGVIGCAAGFPSASADIPRTVPFSYYGIAGSEDFNLPEMRRVEAELAKRDATFRIVTFDGTHAWPPAEHMTRGVEWFELEAMRAGLAPRDPTFITAQREARLVAVPTEPALDRWRELRSLAADFAGLGDTAELAREAAALATSPRVKQELAAERALFGREEKLINRLGDVASGGSLRRKEAVARELRLLADAPEDSAERQTARRVISSYFSISRETVRGFVESKEYARAAAMLEMGAALRPNQPKLWLELARMQARDGATPAALGSLQHAADVGLADAGAIEEEPAFDAARASNGYKSVRAAIAANAADPVAQLPELRVATALASVQLRIVYLPRSESGLPMLGYLRVEYVTPGTVAAAAGVEIDMEVTAIQGLGVRGLTDAEFAEAMSRPVRDAVVITVRRRPGAWEREIRIPLSK